jgi:hypothetical protein
MVQVAPVPEPCGQFHVFAAGLRARRGPGLQLAEVYREQARFEDAQAVIAAIAPTDGDVAGRLIGDLIARRWTAPVRYRM